MLHKLKIETGLYFLLLLVLYYIQYQHAGRVYVDTDNYMHVLRAIDFIQQPSMFERPFMQTNYPFGEVSHWTRLMDILLAICALPFLLYESLRDAVFSGGFLLTPLCAVGVLCYLQKIGQVYFNCGSRFVMYAMLLMSATFRIVFKVNRPDHHAVIILLTVWLLWLLSTYSREQRKAIIMQAAAVCAVALWLAVEGIFLYACTVMFLYAGYTLRRFSYRDIICFCTVYAGGVLVFWLINPPYEGCLYADNGRISVLYTALFVAVAGIVALCGKIRSRSVQFVMLCSGAGVCLGILWFGGYMQSPLSPAIAVSFTNRISEMRNGANIYHMAYPILGCISLSILLYKRRQIFMAVLLGCFLLPYMFLSAMTMRFAVYAILYGILALTLGLSQLQISRAKFIFLSVCLCLTEVVSFVIYSLVCYDVTKPVQKVTAIDVNFLARYAFEQGAVVSDVFMTPNILWYAQRPTVASPYHRNVEGIVDNHNILMNPDMHKVAALLRKHQVRTIILLLSMDENYYREPAKNTDKVYGKMLSGQDYPVWLQEDATTRAKGFVVVKVLPDKMPAD